MNGDTVARIVVLSNTEAAAYVPYDYRHIPRSMPNRRWDRQRKAWLVSTKWLDVLAESLRANGLTVYVHPNDASWPSNGHGSGSNPDADWIEAAFRAVDADNVARLRRGLLAAFHPDRNSDPALAVRINQAADRRHKERRP